MPQSENVRFVALDLLRGFAAILVTIYHFHGDWTQGSVALWRGHLGVDFFFVLSGFVIAHTYIYNREGVSSLAYIWRRLTRLYPLHIFSLLTFLGAAWVAWHGLPQYDHGPPALLLQEFTLTQNVGFNADLIYNYPDWSVSVEFWVSVVLFLLIGRKTPSYLLLLTACAGLLVIYFNLHSLDAYAVDFYGFINGGLIRGATSFLLGILTYRLFLREDFRKIPVGYLEPILLAAIAVIIFGGTEANGNIDFAAPFVFAMTVAVFAREEGIISNLLSKVSHLGTISYSIYLNQVTVLILFTAYIRQVFGIQNEGLALALYLMILVVYSDLTYRYVEEPSRKWGRRFFKGGNVSAGNESLGTAT